MTLVKDIPIDISSSAKHPTLKYNGIVIGGRYDSASSAPKAKFHLHLPEIDVSVRIIYDRSGRRVENKEYSIHLRSYLLRWENVDGENRDSLGEHDSHVQSFRSSLEATGTAIQLPSGLGGDIIHGDVFSVRPQSLSLRPTGLNNSLYFEWHVVVLASNHDPLTNEERDPSALSASLYPLKSLTWGVSHSLNQAGLATRTINGRGTITGYQDKPGTYDGSDVSSNVVIDGYTTNINADWLRSQLIFYKPDQMRRISQDFSVSEDKTQLQFRIVDKDFDGDVYPLGLEYADGSYQLQLDASTMPAFSRAFATLKTSFVVAPGYHPSTANWAFFNAVMTTQARIISNLNPHPDGITDEAGNKKTMAVIPISFGIQRGLYDSARQWSGEASWMLVGCIRDLILSNGFWQPVDSPTAADWTFTMEKAGVNRPHGRNGWLSAKDDDWLQLHQEEHVDTYRNQTKNRLIGDEVSFQGPDFSASVYQYLVPEITPDNSWLYFDVDIKVLREQEPYRHRPAIPYVPTPDGPTAAASFNPVANIDDPNSPGYASGSTEENAPYENTEEYRGGPVTKIQVSYVGVRVGFTPDAPKLRSLQGASLTPLEGRKLVEGPKVIGSLMGYSIYLTKRVTVYSVNGRLKDLRPHDNETICFDYTDAESVNIEDL